MTRPVPAEVREYMAKIGAKGGKKGKGKKKPGSGRWNGHEKKAKEPK